MRLIPFAFALGLAFGQQLHLKVDNIELYEPTKCSVQRSEWDLLADAKARV